ncbi:Benzoate anaerobic degradation regulator [Anaerohalosphaera lusitana]|uniref:Benzoate anaerobic degradation regulator n=1 Tax=Anaerohalosphaera lusitana TaxID=1936003 RepID=A0A1U9NRE5_9BACT|nr:MarR family transcriptional regulator [Anaerohalosphaera lusitana]AQT70190.1 Benzoate anaerobic degradation regulator [Anaerohalosphaera lusitana]
MTLKQELNLDKDFRLGCHEVLLNVYFTAALMKKRATEFLKPFGLTDVQLNVMLLLANQGGGEGLSQARLSEMMLVNRANVTTLVDRMEKAGLVKRTAQQGDRRFNIVKLTSLGRKLLNKVEPRYGKEVQRIMGTLKKSEQKDLMRMLEKMRANI